MTMAAEASILNPATLFLEADPVVKAIMIGLAIASLWSWAVIVDKALRFLNLNNQATAFERAVGSGRPLEDIAAQAGPDPAHPLPRMLLIALTDWREARTRGPLTEGQGTMLMARIDRALDSLIAREGQKVEGGLGVLSIIATASPFIGLFGTVWGIMNSFIGIAKSQTTNLAVVAPGIAEALLATAIGLVAAIPAVVIYNVFARSIAAYKAQVADLSSQVLLLVSRDLDHLPPERSSQPHMVKVG